MENPSRFYCCCKTGVQPKSLGGGGCCNLHKKTFWTTQEAVGTALDSSFATECIQHSKCIQAARVLERQTAKTRGLTPVQDEKNRKIQHFKNSLFITAKWVHGPLRTPPRRRTAPPPTPPPPCRRTAPGPAPAVLPGPPQAGPLCLRSPRLHRDKAALTRLPCHCCAEWGGALAGPARRPPTRAPSGGGEALVRLRASVTVGLIFI